MEPKTAPIKFVSRWLELHIPYELYMKSNFAKQTNKKRQQPNKKKKKRKRKKKKRRCIPTPFIKVSVPRLSAVVVSGALGPRGEAIDTSADADMVTCVLEIGLSDRLVKDNADTSGVDEPGKFVFSTKPCKLVI
jgi:hypothetical protein